jgi:DNA repair exonuclease SbcCD nuclease subunit
MFSDWVGLTADWHLRYADLDAATKQIHKMLDVCIDRGVKDIFISGDIFNKATIHDDRGSTGLIGSVFSDWLGQCRRNEIHVLVTPGDHDIPGAGARSALGVFCGKPELTIVNIPFILKFKETEDSFSVLAVPWQWSPDRPAEEIILQALAAHGKPVDLMIGHLSIMGGAYNVKKSMDYESGGARARQWVVSREFLAGLPVKHIGLGDFHRRQDLADGRGGYIGAIRQLNFGEETNPAGFELWNPKTDETEWVELDEAPKHVTRIIPAGTKMTNPMPKEMYQVHPNICARWMFEEEPDPIVERQLQEQGVRVDREVKRVERARRADDIEPGIVENDHALIDLWAGQQEPPLEPERIARMKRVLDETLYPEGVDHDIAF